MGLPHELSGCIMRIIQKIHGLDMTCVSVSSGVARFPFPNQLFREFYYYENQISSGYRWSVVRWSAGNWLQPTAIYWWSASN
jgi:hypothetical protein